MATTPRKDLPSTNAPNWNQRVTEELRVLMGRAGNGRALTAKDLIDSGIAKPGAGGGLVPGVPGGGDTEPDLTPPPMPTGFAVSAGLSTVFVEHDAPGYTQGHGHDRTVVYGVLQTGSTAPTFDQAVVLFQFQGTIGAYPAALGTRYRLWIKWQSQDGVQSVSPAGGTNGLDVQTGKIGNNDLGPLIVEAGNLANGSVSASKLAAQAVDATKFAAGIEPVSVSTAGTLPTVKSTSTIVWQGKLYRWDGSKYTAAVPTVDLTGTIIASQIAAGAVDVTKFASGIEPVTNSAAASLPTVKTTTVITWQGKLYRWDGAKYTAEVAVVDLSGQIDAAKLADNAVTVSKIAAGAVEAGKLATGAVTADKIAAAAVDTTKFASGIEPVTNSTASTLPTVKSTTTITWQGKLYRWDGSKYTAAVPTTDLTGTVASAQIADSAVTLAKIATGSVDTTKFAAGIEPVSNSTAGTLPTVKSTTVITWQGKLYRWDGSKYSAEVAVGDMVGQIAATQIADNAITTPKLAANAVVADKIAANAVVAAALSADAVTAGKIAAGAVNTRELAANSVTASKLVITATDAVNVDPFFQDADIWTFANFTRKAAAGSPGPFVLSSTVNPYNVFVGSRTPIDTSKTYLFETWFIALGANVNRAFATVRFYDVNGNALINADAPALGWPGYNAGNGNYYFPSTSVVTPESWTRYTVAVGPNGTAKFPPKAAYFAVGCFLNYGGVAPMVESQWGGIRITEMARGELVVDGAITAAKIAAGSVLASKLVVSDPSTMIPDAEYQDLAMWSGVTGGTVQFKLNEPSPLAGTVSKSVLQINRVNSAGSGSYDGGASTLFGVLPNTDYVLRVNVWAQAAATIRVQVETRSTTDVVTYAYSDYTPSTANWVSAEVAFKSNSVASRARVLVMIREDSTASFVYVGKIRFAEAAAGSLIVDGAVTAVKIAAKTITAGQIAAGAISATELAAGAVTAGKIAAGSITATELAANSVTALQLAANAVTAGKIAANAVTADSIAANSVTTAKIAAGAVSATELAAGSVLASKLLVADTTNVYGDFDCVDPDYCTAVTGSFVYSTSGAAYNGKNIVNIPPFTGATEVVSNWFVMDAGAEYLITQRISTSVNDATGLASTYIELASYNSVTVVPTRRELIGQTGSTSANPFTLSVALTTGERYGRIIYARAAGGTSRAYIGAPTIRRKNGGNLIVDGAITASKMVLADTSNAYPDFDMLDDGGYSSDTAFDIIGGNSNYGSKRVLRILAGTAASVDAMVMAYADRGIQVEANSQYLVSFQMSRINSGTAGTVQFLTRLGVNTSQTAITWDAAVAQVSDTTTVTNITYRSFVLTTGTRTRLSVGMRILSGAAAGGYLSAITIRKMNGAELIVDGAVTAGKIATNAVTADKIEANAITAAKIAVGAVGADQIAANAITVKQLTVMDYSNIVLDPFIQDTTSWATFTGTQVTAATSGVPVNMPGPAGILLSKATAQSVLTRNFQTSPGEVYYLSAYVASPTTTGYAIRLMMQFIDPTGAQGSANGTHVGWAAAITLTAPAAVNTWQKIEGFVTVPAGVAFGRARIVSETGSAVAGSWYATNFVCRRATSASLIVDGAITATKIAAGAIAVGSAAIQDGAIVNAMIGNLSADKITAGTLNAARIAAGTITSSHLSANSVIAGKIAANAVTAGTIAANAVTATQIAAGAITVDKLAAGSITAEKLSVGIGGNLCPDPMFTPGLAFWQYTISHSQYGNGARGVNMNFDYTVPGTPTLFLEDLTLYGQGQPLGTYRKGFVSAPISVIAGERYEASVYAAFHRCHGEMYLEFFDANGTWVGGGGFGVITDQPSGGRSLANFRRTGGFVTAPAGAITARITILSGAQMAGTSWSNYMFLARPFVGRASALQTELSPWSPNSNTSILPDGITTLNRTGFRGGSTPERIES